MNNFQRKNSVSNTQVGNDFEAKAHVYFANTEKLVLQKIFPLQIGVDGKTGTRRFDLGAHDPAVLVECKSHRWTESWNMPSAKVTVWNEAMCYFHLAPQHFRKVLFVLKHVNPETGKNLARYYVDNYNHLIPNSVEIIEFDEDMGTAAHINL